MGEVKFINQSTWKQKLKTYKKHPGSFLMLLLVGLSAIVTMGLLLFLIAYILEKQFQKSMYHLLENLTYTT